MTTLIGSNVQLHFNLHQERLGDYTLFLNICDFLSCIWYLCVHRAYCEIIEFNLNHFLFTPSLSLSVCLTHSLYVCFYFHACLCLYFCLSICNLSDCVSLCHCLSLSLSLNKHASLSVPYISVYLFVSIQYLSVCLFIFRPPYYLSLYLNLNNSVCLSVSISLSVSVLVCVSLSVSSCLYVSVSPI